MWQGKLVDNEAEVCYLVVLNKQFSKKLAPVIVPQNNSFFWIGIIIQLDNSQGTLNLD
ncbi:hypothetical protein PPHE_a2341 [Pseudoalteromonas phenolica O-BC30]|nr:hypothetical protein [Pseudoalteromonas phenolica O-BC30]